MELDVLTAISPIDGRYRNKTQELAGYFSEYALIRYRVRVEIEYFITLCELPLPQLENFDHKLFESLRDIYRHFTEQDAARVKEIEQTTNHDVKAVEYFIKEKINAEGVGVVMECHHLCMMMRGVEKQNSCMVTSSMLGSFRRSVATRTEFLQLIDRKTI